MQISVVSRHSEYVADRIGVAAITPSIRFVDFDAPILPVRPER